MWLQSKNLNKVGVITLWYIEVLLEIVLLIWFLYPSLHWSGGNIHARVYLIQWCLGQFDSIGNQLTLDSYIYFHMPYIRKITSTTDYLTSMTGKFLLIISLRLQFQPSSERVTPFYDLQTHLYTIGIIRRWYPRSKMVLYLVPSPRHSCSISLVFNIETEIVSLQFHVQHDDLFKTLHPTDINPPTLSLWK